MRFPLTLLALAACAGPTSHLQPEASSALGDPPAASRGRVSVMLDANEPLEAPACPSPDGRVGVCAGSSEAPAPHQHRHGPAEPSVAPSSTVIDPVCGMKVNASTTAHSVTINGRTTSFCSLTCKRTFLASLTDGGAP